MSRMGTAQQREWSVGDRCRVEKLGEWRNGTIRALLYDREIALVRRDGEAYSRHTLTANLREAVDE